MCPGVRLQYENSVLVNIRLLSSGLWWPQLSAAAVIAAVQVQMNPNPNHNQPQP